MGTISAYGVTIFMAHDNGAWIFHSEFKNLSILTQILQRSDHGGVTPSHLMKSAKPTAVEIAL